MSDSIGTVYSNLEREVDAALEAALRADPEAWAGHAAWDHFGRVRFDPKAQEFVEEVWHYGSPQEEICAPDLLGLMTAVNDEWGWD